MALSFKALTHRPERLAPGHRACAGCTAPIVLRTALKMTEHNVVAGMSTGCMEVVTTIYPYTSWKCSYIHNAFENVAATISGVESAYRALKARGKMKDEYRFIAMGGDGGTYDIGLQSLSGALERGHKMLFICYDNEGYMNTGIQRSSATPKGAFTNTSQAGKAKLGKEQHRKDLTGIVIAHHIPYVAQAAVHRLRDFMNKVEKAFEVDGPSFINILAPCHRGWRFPVADGLLASRLATETCFWPLWEVTDGKWKLNYKPKEKKPVEEWLKMQGRFKHLFQSDEGRAIIEDLQRETDTRWDEVLERCGEASSVPAK